jgi:hypothetical protein
MVDASFEANFVNAALDHKFRFGDDCVSRPKREATMARLISVLSALCWALLTVQPSFAKDMRFPESGDPAFSFRMPDNWTSRVDSDGNMLLTSGDRSAAFSLSHAVDGSSLDDIANGALGVAKADETRMRAAASISGFAGLSYATTMTNDAGVKLRVKMIIVRIDETHVATCTKIEANNSSAEQRKVADTVLASMRLTPAH